MALINCHECSKGISDKAPNCPHCGAPKEEQPTQVEEVEILVAPSTEPESVATKEEPFNKYVAIVVGAFVWQIARSLGMNFGFLTVIFLAIPYALLVFYGKKQSPKVYARIIGALVVVLGIAIAAGRCACLYVVESRVGPRK